MFDAAARTALEETLGYERYVLWAACQAVRKQQGICTTGPITIDDAGRVAHSMLLQSFMGDTGAGMTQHMSPLVFSAAYKLLDMVMEWTLCENGVTPERQFTNKIHQIQGTPTMSYPDFLGADTPLRDATVALYVKVLPYRNAITHNKWGTNVGGDLHFRFTHQSHQIQAVFPLAVVLGFADAMSMMGEMLVNGPADLLKVDTLKWTLDQCQLLHGQPPFGIGQPRFFQVIRRTTVHATNPVVIDLDEVRNKLASQAAYGPFLFDLRVVAETDAGQAVWEIPSSSIPASTQLVLDASWDGNRVSS